MEVSRRGVARKRTKNKPLTQENLESENCGFGGLVVFTTNIVCCELELFFFGDRKGNETASCRLVAQ